MQRVMCVGMGAYLFLCVYHVYVHLYECECVQGIFQVWVLCVKLS